MVGRVTPTILALTPLRPAFAGEGGSLPLSHPAATFPAHPSAGQAVGDRDAAFVLDGLLYNESDLEIEEHYTDTHGYTELNFAAFAMLGRRFCPRIKDLKHQHIYRIDTTMDCGQLARIVGRADRTIDHRRLSTNGTGWGNSMRHWKAATRLRR